MGTPYIGEIRMVGFNFAPQGWAFCDGSIMAIADNDALFNLIGTTYGGDGQSTFALPDLRGRAVVHQGNGYALAAAAGTEQVTLTAAQLPAHTHLAQAAATGTASSPAGAIWAGATGSEAPYATSSNVGMAPAAVGPYVGQAQPHTNLSPYLAINFIISMFGIFPSQS